MKWTGEVKPTTRMGKTGGVDIGCRRRAPRVVASPRCAEVIRQFGLPPHADVTTILQPSRLPLAPGHVVLIVGPSGSGKTTALQRVYQTCPGALAEWRVGFPTGRAIIDHVAPWAALSRSLSILTACGLGEARLWVRSYETLSDGERFRARLARGVALQCRGRAAGLLLCDEFCGTLHERLARAVSFNLGKLARRCGLSLVVASGRDDIAHDLRPDTILRLHGEGRCEITPGPGASNKVFSLRRRLRIERGTQRDYHALAAAHYRGEALGYVDKVFVLRDERDVLGVVVYAFAPLELALRNRATGGWFSRRPDRVNTHLRILRRLVIHPDVRGCGLGHYLVRETLPQVGTGFVECLASMGGVNPVFRKAGMTRIGRYQVSGRTRAAVERLRALRVDPRGESFAADVTRCPRVRGIVAALVRDWYAGTTGGGMVRVDRQTPAALARTFRALIGSTPVYYLWRRCP